MNKLLFLPILLVWFGCSSTVPNWISVQPSDSKYWHGIGRVDKSDYPNPRSSAKEFAIQEVSTQIKVNISSEMKTIIRESNGSLQTTYSSVMASRVDLLLPELEIVGYYRTKDAYFAYVRLNKQKYRTAMARLRENAKIIALDFIQEADENFGIQSFQLIQKAWQEILPFSDEPIQVMYRGKRFHLYSLVKRKLNEYEARIKITGTLDFTTMKLFVDRENSLQILVTDKQTGTILSGIPVLIKSITDEISIYSDRLGKITYDIPVQSMESSFSIKYELDDQELFKDLSYQNDILPMNSKSNSIHVDVVKARVSIESSEKNLGRPLNHPMIAPAIKDAFTSRVEFVKGNSDMIIKIESDTYKKSDRNGKNYPYFTYGNASITFKDSQTGEDFFSSHISNIKGGDFGSQSTAGIRAYEKMVNQIVIELENQLLSR
ncbi:MAG: LPP20 family lipoprotein [Candidatus Marinimicrobia bacterium]|nr:LPP20 family lipoprotein [Candidatus Neomarinimicrobiota bacterium]MBT4752695.1 LPP20 family lipoprotein [Candidatus Neomarinimicrobiota bacterium]